MLELLAASLRGAGIADPDAVDSYCDTHGASAVERAWFHSALDDPGAATTLDHIRLRGVALTALTCDSVLERLLTADGRVLDYGRSTRSVPKHLTRAVTAHDQHCRAPGCRRAAHHGDIHHVTPWALGGPTSVDNLVLLCRYHHHLFHKPGWSTELDPDGLLRVTNPHGRVHETRPPGAARPSPPRRRRPGELTRAEEDELIRRRLHSLPPPVWLPAAPMPLGVRASPPGGSAGRGTGTPGP